MLRWYTLGFHHLKYAVSDGLEGNENVAGLLELNWKDGGGRWVWVRRSF
jgi:hypothetical protein